jgi:hypothetical protein
MLFAAIGLGSILYYSILAIWLEVGSGLSALFILLAGPFIIAVALGYLLKSKGIFWKLLCLGFLVSGGIAHWAFMGF